MNTRQIAARFEELAMQEKWFEIQDELFADDVRSVEPAHSPWLGNASGKIPVRQKGEDFVKRIEQVHHVATSAPIVAESFFVVARVMDITVRDIGRIKIDQLMMYEVKNGKIVLEQFYY